VLASDALSVWFWRIRLPAAQHAGEPPSAQGYREIRVRFQQNEIPCTMHDARRRAARGFASVSRFRIGLAQYEQADQDRFALDYVADDQTPSSLVLRLIVPSQISDENIGIDPEHQRDNSSIDRGFRRF
jgi:hypothetical protein